MATLINLIKTLIIRTIIFLLPELWSERVLIKIKLRRNVTKEKAFILFIDDQQFPIVQTLNDSGWNVKRIPDLENFQNEDVKRADIIFVDYKGVGNKLSPKDEGLGVIKGIKSHYKDKKRVILYSGHTGFSLGKHLDWADGQVKKNSQAYEFIAIIEKELKELK